MTKVSEGLLNTNLASLKNPHIQRPWITRLHQPTLRNSSHHIPNIPVEHFAKVEWEAEASRPVSCKTSSQFAFRTQTLSAFLDKAHRLDQLIQNLPCYSPTGSLFIHHPHPPTGRWLPRTYPGSPVKMKLFLPTVTQSLFIVIIRLLRFSL